MDTQHKALVVLSGGQDSTTCLYWARKTFSEVHAITFDYGQRHIREVEAAKTISHLAAVASHEILEMGPILKGTSPLISDNKLEQYKDFDSLPGGLEKTFVPMRNALFLVIAANRAVLLNTFNIVTGICQEDFGGYPDCRESFRFTMERAIEEALDTTFMIHAPLMYKTKAQSVQLAAQLPGCMAALAYSHTSYDGAYPPTGKDHATLLRAKGFEQAGYPDPLIVRAWREGLMELPRTKNYATLHRGEQLELPVDGI